MNPTIRIIIIILILIILGRFSTSHGKLEFVEIVRTINLLVGEK